MDDYAVYEARIEIVDFLIETFWDVPGEEFVAELLDGDLRFPEDGVNEHLDEGFDRLRTFVEENRGRDPDAVQEELETEYTAVFVGPRPPVLAHETYYREDTEFIGEGLAEVEASYAAAGWNPPEDYGEENDFIAVELAFLRYLIGLQRDGHEEAFGYERVFLDEHLSTWVEAFHADVGEETDADLYRAAASLFLGLVEFEDEIVAQMVAG